MPFGSRLRSIIHCAQTCPVFTASKMLARFLGSDRTGWHSLLALLFLALRLFTFLSPNWACKLSKSTELIRHTLAVECVLQPKVNSVLFRYMRFQPLTSSILKLW